MQPNRPSFRGGILWLRRIARSLGPGAMRQSRSSIALVGATVIAALVGLAAVGVDLGNSYVARVSDQRAADSAAYAGALAYNTSGSTTTMQSAAGNLATLNGYSSAATNATLVPSPSGDGNNAVQVTISAPVKMYLSEVFQSQTSHTVQATSYAEVKATAAACIIALQANGSGITLSGGTAVTANNCTIASDNTVSVPCGTTITTKTLNYNSAAVPSAPCGGIKPPSGTASVTMTKKATADPLASNATIAGAFTHLAAVATETGPSGPTVSAGTTISASATAPARRRASSRRSAARARFPRRPGPSPAQPAAPTSLAASRSVAASR